MGHRRQKNGRSPSTKKQAPSADSKPFGQLKAMLEEKAISLPSDDHGKGETSFLLSDMDSNEDEASLFQRAMADVAPLPRGGRLPIPPKRRTNPKPCDVGDVEALRHLRHLVKYGKGFVVADTSEYIEGVRYCDNPEVAKRLHRGDFSIQSHIDLHGLITADAREALEEFLWESVASGKRAVLVVHGRGLSSPGKPVLKAKVQEWLIRGPWRKWVIAYASARPCDGGAGATYVLLRRRPTTKRFRKQGRGAPP